MLFQETLTFVEDSSDQASEHHEVGPHEITPHRSNANPELKSLDA